MAFPDGFLDEVRHTADIVRVIGEHVSLRKVGNSWKGLCPFHQEKSPSFNVRSDPAVFHCFGCGEGGDVFKFVMLHDRVGFPEAVRNVATRFGVPLPREASGPPDTGSAEREEILAAVDAAARHYTEVLWSPAGTTARDYLLRRGFQRKTLEQIRAGAARDAWGDVTDMLRRKHPLPLLVRAGLAIERQDGKGAYDRFRNRAVFPILNDAGKVVGFGARSLDGSEPKYLNSPETPVYQKSRVLYGLSWAKEAVRRDGRLILMEGYLDVARALEAGVGGAVATCGTALTPGHARLLRRFAERICVNFDQDDAGQRAAQKSVDILLEEGLRIHVVQLPQGHDPDTYLKEFGAEAYQERLSEAPSYVQWLIDRAAQSHDLGAPEGKAGYLNLLLPVLARIESAVERAAWLPSIVERGRLDGRAAQEELRKAVAARATTAPARVTEMVPPPSKRNVSLLPAERLLLVQLLGGKEEAIKAFETLEDEYLESLALHDVFRAIRTLCGTGHLPSLAAVEGELKDDGERRFLRKLLLEDKQVIEADVRAGTTVSPVESVYKLRMRALDQRLAAVQKRLDGAVSDDKLTALLLLEKTALLQKKRAADAAV
jgi:DNA primase